MPVIRTSVNVRHSHTIDTGNRRGNTSRAGVNNHTHAYSIDSDGNVTIREAEGHIHTAAPVKQRDDNMSTKKLQAVIPFEIKSIHEDQKSDFFRFKGLASTFRNVDFGGDIVQPKSFDNTIQNLIENKRPIPDLPGEFKLLPILWQHNMDEPLGSFTSLRVTQEGLEVEGIMPKSDTFVSGRVIPQMRAGSVGEMSIGYIAIETSRNSEGNRLLEEIMLFEASLVTVAMNPKALINEMKGAVKFQDLPLASRDCDFIRSDAETRIREFTESEDTPRSGYKKAFLFVDPDASDEYESHKFQIADIIDGKMSVIPRAVFKAAAQVKIDKTLSGAQKRAAIDSLDRYYDKLGLDSPFLEKSCFRIDDLAAIDPVTLEKTLKTGGVFPGEIAKTIVSALKSMMCDAESVVKCDADQKEAETMLANLKSTNKRLF